MTDDRTLRPARPRGLSRLNQWRSTERGARPARRDEEANWGFATEEQRSQAGCPTRPTALIQPRQATNALRTR